MMYVLQREKDRCIRKDWAGKLGSEKEDTPDKSDWDIVGEEGHGVPFQEEAWECLGKGV